jgi:hypothetical protein
VFMTRLMMRTRSSAPVPFVSLKIGGDRGCPTPATSHYKIIETERKELGQRGK